MGILKFLVLLWAAALPVAAAAADAVYPSKAIRFVVPGAAGSAPDIRARYMAPKLAEALGQPVVVDNRPGAQGNIGRYVVTACAPSCRSHRCRRRRWSSFPARRCRRARWPT